MLVSHSTTVFYSFSKEAGRFIKREKEPVKMLPVKNCQGRKNKALTTKKTTNENLER